MFVSPFKSPVKLFENRGVVLVQIKGKFLVSFGSCPLWHLVDVAIENPSLICVSESKKKRR